MRSFETAAGKNRAFTLIDLLTVIAIIAVLASLLLPGLARAKAIAQATKCKSNLRQMAAALAMYLGDSQGEYPFAATWDSAVALNLNGPIGPRFEVHGMKCPSWKTEPGGPFRAVSGPVLLFRHEGTSYGYNAGGFGGSDAPDVPVGLGGLLGTGGDLGMNINLHFIGFVDTEKKPPMATLESQVTNPAEMIALGDGYQRALVSDPNSMEALLPSPILVRAPLSMLLNAPREHHAPRRHRGLLNMAFADGHVEDGKIEKWYFSEADNHVRLWRVDNQPRKD